MLQLLALLCTLLAVGAAALLLSRQQRIPAGLRPIPAPPSSLFLGHIPYLRKHLGKGNLHIDVLCQQLVGELGKVFMFNVLFFRMVIVADLDMVKEIITRNYPKSFTYNRFHPLIGGHKSILVLEDDAWKRQRTAFNPGFSYQHLRTLVPTFVSNTRRLVERLASAAERGEVVSLHKLLTILTLNIICHVVLDKDFDLLSDERAPELFTRLSALLDCIQWYSNNPGFGWTRRLPWNKREIKRLERLYDELLLDVIKQRMPDSESGFAAQSKAHGRSGLPTVNGAGGGAGKDLGAIDKGGDKGGVGRVIGSTDKGILSLAMKTAKEEGSALDSESILAQVKTFLFAGHDTTASTLAWAVYEVSRNPEVEKKLVQEIHEVCGSGDPTPDDLSRLHYADCVVKETLRLWPPAGAARVGPAGAVLNGYAVEGLVLYIPHYVIQRDPDLWGPDANVFRPERWLDEDAISRLNPLAYQPFSKGPRDCIGQTFAKLEAKTLLAMLFSKFSFRYAGKEPERQIATITSHPKFGVPVHVDIRTGL